MAAEGPTAELEEREGELEGRGTELEESDACINIFLVTRRGGGEEWAKL